MISAEALAFLRGPQASPRPSLESLDMLKTAVDREAEAEKTWLERPPIAQVRIADLTGDSSHDLGVLERAAAASGGYVQPGSAKDLRMRAGYTLREQAILFGSAVYAGADDAQT
jgi:hypothetical protein